MYVAYICSSHSSFLMLNLLYVYAVHMLNYVVEACEARSLFGIKYFTHVSIDAPLYYLLISCIVIPMCVYM